MVRSEKSDSELEGFHQDKGGGSSDEGSDESDGD